MVPGRQAACSTYQLNGRRCMNEVYLLIAYDIVDDKRRNRLAKYLGAFFQRRQKSLFEGWLATSRMKKFTSRLEEIMDGEEDAIRIFKLCENCRKHAILLGAPMPLIPQHQAHII
ncbi:CRISPR-associated endonuclease Cas2 [bacterium]|nr:CRISPR-associated endonuclease Cas2 [bacterium]